MYKVISKRNIVKIFLATKTMLNVRHLIAIILTTITIFLVCFFGGGGV